MFKNNRGGILQYIAPVFDCAQNIKNLSFVCIESFPWNSNGYMPKSCAAIFALENKGIHAVLKSFEQNVRCECTKRDDPVYTDSCLELFLMPIKGDKRYINIEANKNGVFLSQIGTSRNDRIFTKEITDAQPVVVPLKAENGDRKSWGVDIFLPNEFISQVYQTNFAVCETVMKGNFYKCGDLTEYPHYGSYFPIKTEKPDFHRPEFFGEIIFRKA